MLLVFKWITFVRKKFKWIIDFRFIDFTNDDDANCAVQFLNNYKLGDYKLLVRLISFQNYLRVIIVMKIIWLSGWCRSGRLEGGRAPSYFCVLCGDCSPHSFSRIFVEYIVLNSFLANGSLELLRGFFFLKPLFIQMQKFCTSIMDPQYSSTVGGSVANAGP